MGILIATFLAISLLFFFASFFDAFLGRSWLRFPSQLASQNRPKSKKNRCQDAIHLGLRFLIDFWSVLALNLDPFDPKKLNFSFRNNKAFCKIGIRSSHRFLIPFWSQRGFILGPKIDQISPINRPQEASKKRSIFASVFYRFLIDLGSQLGAMLAAFSAQQGGGNEVPPSFLLRCFFEPIFFEFLAPGADGVPHFWPPSPMGYPIFVRFLDPI